MKNIVTIFRSVKGASAGFNRDIFFALERIRNGTSKDLVEQIRAVKTKEERNELKIKLPGVTFNGSFRYRNVSGLINHSGLCIVDFDNFNNQEDAITFRDSISSDNYIFACWISPSADGVKALIKIPPDEKNHKSYFDALAKHFDSQHWDSSGSDLPRFCYESYDPDIYINPNSEIWVECEEPDIENIGTYEPVISIKSDNRIISNLQTWFNKKYGATKGNRNNNIFKLASAFNDFGVGQTECETVLFQYESDGFNRSEITNIVKSAYKKTGNFGTKFFEDNEIKLKIEKQIRAGKKSKEIYKTYSEFTEYEIEHCISSIKENISIDDFWYYEGEDNKIRLSPHKYKFWLEQHNFFKYYPTDTSTYTFIRKEQNLLEETSDKRVKDYVMDYLLNRSDIGFIPYDFMATNSTYFKPDFISFLETAEVNLREDTQTDCYLYFRNNVVKVAKDTIEEIDYIDVDGYVWRRQIIDRDFKKSDHHDSEFRKFIWLISGQNVERYNSFKSVIGYLLHSFKTSANNKAIIFNDETISENPNGGSGKGLFWNALSHMKKVSSIDGKTFEFTKSFPYQTVSTDTQILVFDDVKKNFNFESLFSLITEGITLEYKGQDAVKLPVQRSPKILITTNYTVGGIGGSFERRKFEVEMSAYFSFKHTPLDEFGHLLFDDWDSLEWQKFDNYMINCTQYYLQNGLVKHEFNNLEVRKFIKETSFEFYEWSHDDNLGCNIRIDKREYFEKFVSEYQDFRKWLTQKRFSSWLESYGKFNNFKITSGRTNNMRWIEFNKESEEPQDEIPF